MGNVPEGGRSAAGVGTAPEVERTAGAGTAPEVDIAPAVGHTAGADMPGDGWDPQEGTAAVDILDNLPMCHHNPEEEVPTKRHAYTS